MSSIVTQKAKIKLAQHLKELVMTPKQRDGEWVYEMTGEWELLPGELCDSSGGQGRNRTKLHAVSCANPRRSAMHTSDLGSE